MRACRASVASWRKRSEERPQGNSRITNADRPEFRRFLATGLLGAEGTCDLLVRSVARTVPPCGCRRKPQGRKSDCYLVLS